jgi:hypothetical protein
MKHPALWRDTLKKHLLATTAAITMVGGAASAQEWNVGVGGFFNGDIMFSEASGNGLPAAVDTDGAVLNTNVEIVFTPSITLDNGMTFGANVQLEGNTGGDQIDESYMFISSDSMGRVELGSENSAGYKMMTGAPSVGFGIASPSYSAYMPISANIPGSAPATSVLAGNLGGGSFFRNAFGSTATEVARNNDAMRISYYTPSFNGLTLGVSYAPGQGDDTNGQFDRNSGVSDIFDIAANYSQSFGSVDMTLSARWGTGDAGTAFANVAAGLDGVVGTADDILTPAVVQQDDPTTWGVGAQFGVGAFTFGGAYAENDAGAVAAGTGALAALPAVSTGAGDSEGYHLGVTYALDNAWTIGFDTYQGEQNLGSTAGFDNKAEYSAFQLGASRSLGTGVTWRIYAIQAEVKASTNNPAGFNGNGLLDTSYKVESTTIGTGIALTF